MPEACCGMINNNHHHTDLQAVFLQLLFVFACLVAVGDGQRHSHRQVLAEPVAHGTTAECTMQDLRR